MSAGNSIQTVRRGTKRYRRVLETASDCKVYTLGNYFIGADCNPLALADYMSEHGRMYPLGAKLTTHTSGRYTLHVHSNCWFEFSGEES